MFALIPLKRRSIEVKGQVTARRMSTGA